MNISVNTPVKDFCVASLNLGKPNKSAVNFKERVKRLQLICDLSVVKPLGLKDY